jgi:hypothetical protein
MLGDPNRIHGRAPVREQQAFWSNTEHDCKTLVSVLRTGFFITQDNRLARYVLSTRH